MDIIGVPFPDNQYVKVLTPKDIFIIHHTAGRDDANQMYNIWANDQLGRVCTAYGITRNGKIYQGYSTKYWGFALKVNATSNQIPTQYRKASWDATLNSRAVQVELCNWGALQRKEGKLYAWPNNYSKVVVPESEAIFYPTAYREFHWFQAYTLAQIESLRQLILFHQAQDNILLDYHEDMWDTVSLRALEGTPGIWTHTSYRTDKSDCHPQEELVGMLKGLMALNVERNQLVSNAN